MEKIEMTKKCCREIVMAALNLKPVVNATAKLRKAAKYTVQTAQLI
jgi:hypothetical protein